MDEKNYQTGMFQTHHELERWLNELGEGWFLPHAPTIAVVPATDPLSGMQGVGLAILAIAQRMRGIAGVQ